MHYFLITFLIVLFRDFGDCATLFFLWIRVGMGKSLSSSCRYDGSFKHRASLSLYFSFPTRPLLGNLSSLNPCECQNFAALLVWSNPAYTTTTTGTPSGADSAMSAVLRTIPKSTLRSEKLSTII